MFSLVLAAMAPFPLFLAAVSQSHGTAIVTHNVRCKTITPKGSSPEGCTGGFSHTPQSPPAPGVIATPCSPAARTIAIGRVVTASATLQNVSQSTLTIRGAALTIRPPDADRLDGPFDDLAPAVDEVAIPVGETLKIVGSRRLENTDRTGNWTCYLRFQSSDRVWHDGPVVARITVTPQLVQQSCQLSSLSYAAGDTLNATAVLHNGSRTSMDVTRALLTVRQPGGTNAGGPYLDLAPASDALSIQRNESVVLRGSLRLPETAAAGSWYCYVTYQSADGTWQDDPTLAAFMVHPAVVPTSPPVASRPAVGPVTPVQAPAIVSGPPTTPVAPGFLSAKGGQLTFNGKPIRLRGENFNNEPGLSCCGGPNISGIDANNADYAKMRSLGANSIRLGMDYAWFQADRTGFFTAMDTQVGYARTNHLWVILNLFIPPGGSSGGFQQYDLWGNQRNSDLLMGFWGDVAGHYSQIPTVAGYDILNEPAPAADSQWLDLSTRIYRRIRQVDGNHLVVIEAPLSNDLSLFSLVDHVLYSVHHYAGGDDYPSSRPADTPLWVGEFGQVSDKSAVQFVASEIARYEADGVSWCHFVEREVAGFGLFGSYKAGDFGSPWTAMIAAVQSGFAGSTVP